MIHSRTTEWLEDHLQLGDLGFEARSADLDLEREDLPIERVLAGDVELVLEGRELVVPELHVPARNAACERVRILGCLVGQISTRGGGESIFNLPPPKYNFRPKCVFFLRFDSSKKPECVFQSRTCTYLRVARMRLSDKNAIFIVFKKKHLIFSKIRFQTRSFRFVL